VGSKSPLPWIDRIVKSMLDHMRMGRLHR
jgi:hypothetical protein